MYPSYTSVCIESITQLIKPQFFYCSENLNHLRLLISILLPPSFAMLQVYTRYAFGLAAKVIKLLKN